MRQQLLVTILCMMAATTSYANLEELRLHEVQGLLPSFWLDHTGFVFEDEPEVQDSSSLSIPMIPVMPIFKSGGFGRKTYVGGVVEEKYLTSARSIRMIKEKILETRTADGLRFHPYDYQGKIYAIRSDYNVSYQNTTTVGLSLSFGSNKTVVFGESLTYGASLDIGAPLRVSSPRGINAATSFQKIVDDWSSLLSPDDTQMIIDQAVSISPTLISYFTQKPDSLLSEDGSALELLPAQRNILSSSTLSESDLHTEGHHTDEWKRVSTDLDRNLQKEIKWKTDVAAQVKAEKVLSSKKSNEFIQTICDRLASVYKVPQEIWPRCKVSASLTPNAWAYPGGDIFISVGLLGILSELDSVSLVLGHEIGHVTARHISRRDPLQKSFNYGATIVSSAVNLGILGFSLGGGWGALGSVNFLTWYPQTMAVSLGSSYLANKGLELALFAPAAGLMLLSREAESQSDRLGQEAAYSAGADLDSMNKGWKEFVDYFDQNFPQELSLKEKLLSDHPGSSARLQSFQRKKSMLEGRLSDIHQRNALDKEVMEEYRILHRKFKPYSNSYAKTLRAKYESMQKERAGTNQEHKLRHYLQTIIGPHSMCVRHALGAQ